MAFACQNLGQDVDAGRVQFAVQPHQLHVRGLLDIDPEEHGADGRGRPSPVRGQWLDGVGWLGNRMAEPAAGSWSETGHVSFAGR